MIEAGTRLLRGACAGLMLCLVAVSAGCAAGGRGAASPASKTHRVTIESFVFQPSRVDAMVGDTVEWVNRDPFDHSATEDGKRFESGVLAREARAVFSPSRAGTYPYSCALHPTMKGVIVVR